MMMMMEGKGREGKRKNLKGKGRKWRRCYVRKLNRLVGAV